MTAQPVFHTRPPLSSAYVAAAAVSDSDEEGDAGAGLEYADAGGGFNVRASAAQALNMEAHGLAQPMASEFIYNVLRGQGTDSVFTVFNYVVKFKNERNRKECLVLASIIDAARRGDISSVLELAVRRCGGVHTADLSNNWQLCEAFDSNNGTQSFIPSAFLGAALKQVTRMHNATRAGRTAPGDRDHTHSKPRQPGQQHSSGGKQGTGGGGKPASSATK
jgi:hypothetical protein